MLLASCAGVVPKGKPGPVAPVKPVEGAAPVLPDDQQRNRVALLVPLTGPNAAVGQSIANAAGMALIDTGNKSIRMTAYDTNAGAAAADRVVRYAKTRGVTRFAALVPNGVYGRNASTAMIRAVEGAGGNLVAMKSYDRSAKGMGSAVAQLGKGQDYDGVLIADNARIAAQVVPLVRKSSSPQAHIMGTELWAAETALLNGPSLSGAWYASVSDTRYRQLSQAYRRQFGRGPFRLASLGYDSMLLVIKISSGWKVGDRFPVAKLRDDGGFVGVDGAFRFGPSGVAERALEVRELNPAGAKTVAPAPAGFKE